MTADKEKRRAISREAARKRRQVESEVFVDLSRLLPLKPSVRANLDKPSVIRLTLSYIRMHALLKVNAATETSHSVKYGDVLEGGEKWQMCDGGRDDGEKETEEAEALGESHLYLSTLEGFLMVLSIEGDMVYLSDNVSTYMGLTQTELMGHNIFDFTHPADHKEIQDNLQLMSEGLWCGSTEAFVLRIKSTLTHRGRSSNLKSATWKVLNCKGRVMVCSGPSTGSSLLLTCQPLPLSHTLLSTNTFTSQHSMDMRFTYCDQRLMQTLADSPELRKNMPQFLVTLLLGYSPDELLGRSIYDICHTLDTDCLTKNHLNLCLKSQSVSGQYRMLVRGGGYMWVESHSAVIPSGPASKSRLSSHQPLCILCVTYILSGVEEPSLQLSLDQTIHRSQLKMY